MDWHAAPEGTYGTRAARRALPSRLQPLGRRRAQTSAETIMVYSVSLVIVLSFMAFSLSSISEAASRQRESEAYNAAHEISFAADEVYAQGEGAMKTVNVKFPSGTVFDSNLTYIGKPANLSGNSSVESRTVMINYGDGERSATAGETITGSFPSSSGIYRMTALSHGSYVSINPSILEISQYAIHASMAQNENRTFTLLFTNAGHENLNVTINTTWSFSDVNLTLSSSRFSPSVSGTQLIVTVSSGVSASGLYGSSLLVNATTSPSGYSEVFILPVSVEVQS